MTIRIALTLLFVCLLLPVSASDQHATICSFEACPSKSLTGAACYDFTGTICFEKSNDTSKKPFTLHIKFKDGLKMVKANTGFEGHYCNDDMVFTLSKKQTFSSGNVAFYNFTFTVPLSAFNLTEGTHSLAPVIYITDEDGNASTLKREKIAPVTIKFLPVEKIQVWVKHILVDSLDADGQLWDYFLVNPRESNPDIVWSLNYAGQSYFTSKMARNNFEYDDAQQTQTFELTKSNGDTLNIQVKDVDDLTPDDIIGNIMIAPSNMFDKNAVVTAKGSQIKQLQYVITVLK